MDPGRTALVTGGSRGLGAEIALRLSSLGYRVAVGCLGALEEAHKVVAGASGPDAIVLPGDVSSPEEAARMASMLGQAWGRLDLLVNNAGISRDALMPRTTLEDWDAHMDVNLRGPFNMTRALGGLMASNGGGHIINVSSRSALAGKAGQAAYSASKAALIGFTLSAARELAPAGIRVNAVLPGYLSTDMGHAAPLAMEAARGQSLLGCLGDTAEVASFIGWLAGTSAVTGQVFSIDSRTG